MINQNSKMGNRWYVEAPPGRLELQNPAPVINKEIINTNGDRASVELKPASGEQEPTADEEEGKQGDYLGEEE
jgi:hypothetical protein